MLNWLQGGRTVFLIHMTWISVWKIRKKEKVNRSQPRSQIPPIKKLHSRQNRENVIQVRFIKIQILSNAEHPKTQRET